MSENIDQQPTHQLPRPLESAGKQLLSQFQKSGRVALRMEFKTAGDNVVLVMGYKENYAFQRLCLEDCGLDNANGNDSDNGDNVEAKGDAVGADSVGVDSQIRLSGDDQ